MENSEKKTSTYLNNNSYISIGLFISIMLSTFYLGSRMSKYEQLIENHVKDPSLHHNALIRAENNYVNKKEFDNIMYYIRQDLREIKNKLDE